MPTCKFLKKSSLIHPTSCTLLSFSQNASRLLLPKRLWKWANRKYTWKVVLLVIYLFNYNLSKSDLNMWNMAFDVVLSTVFVNKLEFFIYWNTKTTLFFKFLLFSLCDIPEKWNRDAGVGPRTLVWDPRWDPGVRP